MGIFSKEHSVTIYATEEPTNTRMEIFTMVNGRMTLKMVTEGLFLRSDKAMKESS